MYRIIVVTDSDSASGFRLSGAEVIVAEDPHEARKILPTIIKSENIGIIAVREDYLIDLEKTLVDSLSKCYYPIIVPIPVPRKWGTKSGYIEVLLRRAIGYNVVMRS